MITSARPLLSRRDHAILTGIATQGGLGSPAYFRQLLEKLQNALVLEVEAIEPELATLGSLVRYRVNGGRAREHLLCLSPQHTDRQQGLSIKSHRGLALLGMAEGQIFAAPASDPEHPEAVELEMVLFQPEADGALVRCDYDRLQLHGT
ncbi:hypothetical protein PSC71_15710 [Devosia sp. J2-20]|uniref:hypothetical protein n=1 Tax=Devosia sp. J2-20 TaxID=3026161 RepID=UPI002499E0F0|nr:hypothetical protein [Devosia sp. J2-20]WDQ98638.1 hypothetical protein PSC71_15710 [Devosia sp. J2-20]